MNQAYADGMKQAMKIYPGDPDITAWYIDAVILMHSWDFWWASGQPKSWTPEVVNLCEKVLKKYPEHPAALHYYMHLTEASMHPEVALPGANPDWVRVERFEPGYGTNLRAQTV